MPNINLRDGRNRDAMVSAISAAQYATVSYVDKDGAPAKTRKVVKAVGEMTYERLLAAKEGDHTKLADALVSGDEDIDTERIGMFLSDTSRVFINARDEIVYQVEQTEIVRGPSGEEKERRPRRRVETNVDGDIPITWTGKKVAKADALRRFVFASKLQLKHVNGLTYDFLYSMAKELAATDSLMLLGAGKSGKEPLIFRRGQTAYRGFLEGRVDGGKYMLILHLSKMELKRPVAALPEATAVAAAQPTAGVPQDASQVLPAPTAVPVPVAAAPGPALDAPRKPTVKEVIAGLAGSTPQSPARDAIAETVAAAKATKQRKSAATVAAKSAADSGATPAPARKPRAPKSKLVSGKSTE